MYRRKVKNDPEGEKLKLISKHSLQTLGQSQLKFFSMKLNFNLNFTPSQLDKYWGIYLSEMGLNHQQSRKSRWEEPVMLLEGWPSHNVLQAWGLLRG